MRIGRWLVVASIAGSIEPACTTHDPELTRVGGHPLTDAATLPNSGLCIGPGPSQGEFPCAVNVILTTICQNCHNDADPRPNDAPFPLVRFSDTRADYGGEPVWRAMVSVIKTGFMPLQDVVPVVAPLTPAQKQTMLSWLDACARPDPLRGDCGNDGGDAASDAPQEAAPDAPGDASSDGATEASSDSPDDALVDAASDVSEAAPDAPVDGPDGG